MVADDEGERPWRTRPVTSGMKCAKGEGGRRPPLISVLSQGGLRRAPWKRCRDTAAAALSRIERALTGRRISGQALRVDARRYAVVLPGRQVGACFGRGCPQCGYALPPIVRAVEARRLSTRTCDGKERERERSEILVHMRVATCSRWAAGVRGPCDAFPRGRQVPAGREWLGRGAGSRACSYGEGGGWLEADSVETDRVGLMLVSCGGDGTMAAWLVDECCE